MNREAVKWGVVGEGGAGGGGSLRTGCHSIISHLAADLLCNNKQNLSAEQLFSGAPDTRPACV